MKAGPIGFLEFQGRFSTEEACERQLRKMRWPGGYRSPPGAAAASTLTTPPGGCINVGPAGIRLP